MTRSLAAAALGLLAVPAPAADILMVTRNAGDESALESFLIAEGHNVTHDTRTSPGDVGGFQLLIISRSTDSGSLNGNSTAWNEAPLPLINMNPYTYRSNRFGWTSSESLTGITTDSYDSPYPDPGHPFLAFLSAPETTVLDTASGSTPAPVADLVASSEVIATYSSGANLGIFTIDAGTAMNDGKGTTVATRVGFVIGSENAWNGVGSNGEQILINMINFLTAPADSDDDGMSDAYELSNTNPPSPINLDPTENIDGDDLTNFQESKGWDTLDNPHGFGPTRAILTDSDGDGHDDDDEIEGFFNPFQTDTPGVPATTAPGHPTNPNVADSDGDGIDDDVELDGTLNGNYANAPTNPMTGDTDGDQMDDNYEVDNNLGAGLDPNSDDAAGNLDGDSGNSQLPGAPTELTNLDEYLGTTLGIQTRADMLDTDSDGYDDSVEDSFGLWASVDLTGTNPTVDDSDGDGLLDGDENLDLAGFPGLNVLPTNSDPNVFDTDGDGLSDPREAQDRGLNPAQADSDGDSFSDTAELFAYGTDPDDISDFPSVAQVKELRVNFKSSNSAVSADGFEDYSALHENLASFTPQDFSAFDNTITVTPSWDDGGTAVNPATAQMIQRGSNLDTVEWPALTRNFIGTDARAIPGDPMTLTIAGLPAGPYLWTSYHHDNDNQSGPFDATLTDANGATTQTAVDISCTNGDGITEFADLSVYQQVFTSNGISEVTLTFDNNAANPANDPVQTVFFVMNAFKITNTDIPAADPKITAVAFNGGGDLLITFTPGGSGYILTSSDDLTSSFVEETNASYDGSDTFTVPSTALNPGKDFFRVESAP